MRTAFRHRADPTRAGLLQSERFKPYGVSRAHTVEHINAEAGPSTLVPAQDPRVGTQMLLPYAGLSESAADAATTQTNTEDNEVAVSNFYRPHTLHVTEWSFGVRSPSRRALPAAGGCLVPITSRRGLSNGQRTRGARPSLRASPLLYRVSVYHIQ